MQTPLPCPSCSEPLTGTTASCPHCGLQLTGPVAARLWEVDQQLELLHVERTDLLSRLRTESAATDSTAVAPVATAAGPRWTGQQLLLGAGVLLVLVASLVFLAVAWSLIGVLGQVAVMAGLAVVACAAALRLGGTRLRSTAEAVALLGVGMAVVDVGAARTLDLAGLATTDAAGYTAVSAAVLAATWAALGHHPAALSAFGHASIVAAAVAAAATLVAVDPGSPAVLAGALVVTGLVFGALAVRTTGAQRGRGVLATVFATCYVVAGLVVAVPTVSAEPLAGEGGAAALLVLALAAGLWWWAARSRRATAVRVATVASGATLAALALLGVASHADHLGHTALAVTAAAIAAAAAWLAGSGARQEIRTGPLALLLTGQLTALLATAAICVDVLEGLLSAPDPDHLVAATAAVAAAAAATAVATTRPWVRALAAGLAATAALAAVVTALAEHVDSAAVAAAVLTAVAVATAAVAAWRRGTSEELPLGGVGVLGAGAAGLAALGDASILPLAGVLAAVGLTALAYAVLPGRGLVAVVGVLSCSAATWVVARDAGIEVVEVYSLPLALLAAAVGTVHLRRDPTAASWMTTGPALSAALLPSALETITDPGLLRPLAVLGVAAAVVAFGVLRQWQAPLVTGTVALTIVAISQLAPYAVGMPRYLSLGAVGLALLLLGARYEQRRRDALDAVHWVRALR